MLKRVSLFLFLSIFILWMKTPTVLCAPPVLAGGNVLVFPQLVAGGGFISYIGLENTNYNTTVNGTLFVYNTDGSARSIAVDSQPTGSQFSVVIPPGGTVVLSTSASQSFSLGMAKFVSDFPAGGVVRYSGPGGQVGVLSATRQTFATLLLTTNNGNDTGLAISNAGASPVNIRLVYADNTGAALQTVDPPELNPPPPNGQISKFVEQFGLTQAANHSDGSIQIKTMGSGGFNALALLYNSASGQFSTTALVDGVTGTLFPRQFHGSYTGNWNNTTFSTTGTAALSIGVVESTQSLVMRVTLTGTVFGVGAPPPFLFYAGYTGAGVNASGSDPFLGTYTLTVATDGTFTFTSTNISSPNVSGLTVNGTMRGDKIMGTYTVNLRPSGTASGNFELDHTNQ